MMEEEKSPALGLSATDTLGSTTTSTSDKMLNTSDCQQPWEDFVETKETKLDENVPVSSNQHSAHKLGSQSAAVKIWLVLVDFGQNMVGFG